ncbi:hypothetical protein BGZ70_007879 [Mortierella alpina]|uniref:BTB domain-containing protein n=1 Tax=Mortierella alpina TaxID=64518 RepID=A0A9P6J725_MORAP|nr:hypothetical protein BGZ70_007879 [Mortierella alpina]
MSDPLLSHFHEQRLDTEKQNDLEDNNPVTDNTVGLPPVTYMANVIASQLLERGRVMFGRRSDANCILKVGERKYYVHVQMLAARSPTFRRIFDDMIANDAWGRLSNSDGSSEDYLGELDPSSDDMEACDDARAYKQWRVDHCDIEDMNVKLHRLGLRDSLLFNEDDDKGEHGDTSEDSDDTDGCLPELSVDFRDPEGSHFEELLRWIYTGEDERWLRFFTPENYRSILENILRLNMVSKQVLDICLAYEAHTSPDQKVRGVAVDLLSSHSHMDLDEADLM